MNQPVSDQSIMISIMMRFAIAIFFAVAIALLCKFIIKLKWLTSISIAVLLLTLFSISGAPVHMMGVYRGYGFIILLFLGLSCATVLVVRFFQWLFSPAGPQSSVNPEERGRILKMVEDSKITAADGKELLDAMGKSSALRGEEKFSRIDFAILAGVGLVILGFFLPWIYITFARMPGHQSGYQTGAVGWTIFIIAIASAIPVFVTPRNLLYKISMLQIFLTIIGLVLVISVLVQAGDHLGVGLVFCLLGFIVAFVASLAKFKSLAA